MNYLKIYIKLCRRGIARLGQSKFDGKTHELHHIFPKSIYGKNNCLTLLTLREHYISHLLLVKILKKRYGIEDIKTRKMLMAVHKMVYRWGEKNKNILNSRHYDTARKYAALAKQNKSRPDMKGKKFFGASPETIKEGLKKMAQGKVGKKVNYPKDRKSRGSQSSETIEKIKKTKQNTNTKYIEMSDDEFISWLKKYKMYSSDGRKNGNVVRAINARGENLEKYYGNK